MKKIVACIIALIAIVSISCDKEKLTVPDDFTASQGTYIGVVHIAYGDIEGQAVVSRFNEDNAQWEELIWTWSTMFDDSGWLLPNHSIIPGKEYRYKMRLHTDDTGFSQYSNEIAGHAFKADPVEITALNRQVDGDNLQISIDWTNPNELLEIRNLQLINYDIYRTEAGNNSDFSKVKALEQVVINTSDINYYLSYTDTDYLLNPSKSYSYKIVTRYSYDYSDINGTYWDYNEYSVDGVPVTDDGGNGNGGNPVLEYTTTDLGQMAAATQGGISTLLEKNVNGTLYLGIINNAGVTGYGIPELYTFNGSDWQNVWSSNPANEFDKINYAIASGGQYVAGIQDSLCVYEWSGSSWSENLTPNNLGQADAPSSVAIEVDNDDLYMAITQYPDYDLQVLEYNASAWDTIGGDVNGVIASGNISNVSLEKIGTQLYLYYLIDNTLHIQHLNGNSWTTDLSWTKDNMANIDIAKSSSDLYFISGTSNSSYRGGVYKITSTTSAEEIISNSTDDWFQFPVSVSIDSDDNLIVASMKYNEETASFYPHLNVYNGADWGTISGDFSDGIDPASIATVGTDIYYVYGDATSENPAGDPTIIKSIKLSK